MKGIEIYSLDDGSLISKIQKIHFQPIMQLLVKYDPISKEQLVITCSKDQNIKVTDCFTKKVKFTLDLHTEEVNTICLTNDRSMLFSGSNDKTLIAWHTSNFEAMFKLEFDHPIFNLRLTANNNYLIALDRK